MANLKIVAIFAIVIVAAVTGIAWPFLANLQSLKVIPIQASQWYMGKVSQYELEMLYQVYFNNTKFSADMKFLQMNGQSQ